MWLLKILQNVLTTYTTTYVDNCPRLSCQASPESSNFPQKSNKQKVGYFEAPRDRQNKKFVACMQSKLNNIYISILVCIFSFTMEE